MSGLLLHCGGEVVNRQQLREVPCPQGQGRWKPVPHGVVADTVMTEIEERGLLQSVESEQWGLNQSMTQMFGVIRFKNKINGEMTKSIGIRNSINKTLSVGIIASYRLIVCDNLMFSCDKDGVKIEKRHTIGLDITSIIKYTFDYLPNSFEHLSSRIDKLHNTQINDDTARIICCKAAELKAIRNSHITKALSLYFNPIHEEFQPRTLYSLYNSLNELPKEYSHSKAFNCHQRLSELFEEII